MIRSLAVPLVLSLVLAGCQPAEEKQAEATPSPEASPTALKQRGEQLFAANCATCHQATGQGVAGTFPPIAGSEWAQGDPKRHIQVVLKGLSGPIKVLGKDYNAAMPPFGHLSDDEIAAVVTHERTAWGNTGGPVTPQQVKAQR